MQRMLPRFTRLIVALLALVAADFAHATTVTAPTFEELVSEADVIVRARVAAVATRWADSPQGRVIMTDVTFSVLKNLKGRAEAQLTLSFLGGELDGQGMRVAGMPRFAPGDVEIVFVAGNRAQFCPLVAMMHGRYRVLTDASNAREYMARNDGVPLESESEVQLPQNQTGIPARMKQVAAALSPEDFEARIAAAVSRQLQR